MIVSFEETFRPTFGRAMAGVLIGVCALAALGVAPEGLNAIVDVWPWLALVSVASWTCYWNPRVFVSNSGIEIVNPLRTFHVSWAAVVDIETKWALTVRTSDGLVRAWAAPSPGRQILKGQQKHDRRLAGMPKHSAARPSDLTSTESGAAAQIVRQRWVRLVEARHIEPTPFEGSSAESAGHRVRWHIGVIAVLVVLAVSAAASVAW